MFHLKTNDCIITHKVDTGTQANVILKQTSACIPRSVVIEPTNVKSSAYNGTYTRNRKLHFEHFQQT